MAYTPRMSLLPVPAPHRQFNLLTWLRNSFLAGVALVLPFVVTAWLIWTVVTFIDANVIPFLPTGLRPMAEDVPGLGVMFALIALTLVGGLAGNLFGRWIVDSLDQLISNLPVVRSIYGSVKQVFKQVAAPERTSFQEAVLVEFPRAGTWAIGFVTNEDTTEITGPAAEPLVAVFVPHVPLPMSGFLLYTTRAALRPLPIGPEEALKRVISLGIIRHPEADAGLTPGTPPIRS